MAETMELKSLKSALAAKRDEAKRISDTFKVDDQGNFTLEAAQATDYQKAMADAMQIKALIDSKQNEASLDAWFDAPEGTPAAASGLQGSDNGMEAKSLADVFVGTDEYKMLAESLGPDGNVRRAFGSISGVLEGKSLFSLSGGTTTHNTLGQVTNLGLTERAMRKTHIRDLFPSSKTKSATLYGVRETGWVNAARQLKERYAADGVSPATGADSDVYGEAPKSKLVMTPVTIPVAEIAHTIDVHKNLLADEPRLRTFINTRMSDGLKYKEDYDLLHSVGDAESITGLFNQPGVQTYAGLATDKYSVQVRRAITMAQLAEYDPTGLVIDPNAWEALEVEEDDQGGFRVAVNVAIGATKQIWHLDVVATTAMPETKFLIGAFGMGAQLHDRESVSITASSEHADNFSRGIITVRADERCALEVPRPESFVIGNWTDPTP